MRAEQGQATVEHVAIVALVALALGAASALAGGAGGPLAASVVAQLRQALCVVGGGPCAGPRREPCVTRSQRDARRAGGTVAFVRLGRDRSVLREELSDGSVRLTVVQRMSAGVEVGAGSRLRVTVRGRVRGFGTSARAGAEGVLGYGRVYVAADADEARRIMDVLEGAARGELPAASETLVTGGGRVLAKVDLGSPLLGAELDAEGDLVLAARRSHVTGETTLSLGIERAGSALLNVALGGPLGVQEHDVTAELTLDRRGRPLELKLTATGLLGGGVAPPPALLRPLTLLMREDRGGARRWELAARLDLTDARVAAAWRRFRRAPASSAAIRDLGERLRAGAVLDMRAYRLDTRASEFEGAIGAGLRLGARFATSSERARLLAAATRTVGGLWEPRPDCVPARA